MFIDWKNNRVKVIPLTDKGKAASKVKKSNIILLPGINDIPDTLWKVLKEYKSIKASIERGDIEEVEKKVSTGNSGQKKTITTFKELPQKEAEELISQTVNLQTLKKWKKQDTRSDIRVAIEDRIKEIKNYKSGSNMANEG